ncbi:MAG TPA: hypothetical protein VGQ83_14275 [Polyangia bacterium]
MTAEQDARFRLGLARKLLERARDEVTRGSWREAALFGRGAIENAAKAIVACFAAVPRSHEPSALLAGALADPRFPAAHRAAAATLLPRLAGHGMAEHVLLSYGDERNRIDPWSLVTAQHAGETIAAAAETAALADAVLADVLGA